MTFVADDGQTSSFGGPLQVEVSGQQVQFDQPASTGEYLLSFSSGEATGNLSIYAVARQYPDASINCAFITGAFDQLGRQDVEGAVATCVLIAGEDEELRAVFTMRTTNGERVELTDETFVVSAGQEEQVNISLEGWNPAPGVFDVLLAAYDQYGRNLDERSQSVVARGDRVERWHQFLDECQWNINIGVKRSGYTLLADAVCELTVEADGGWSTTQIVDIAYADNAQSLKSKIQTASSGTRKSPPA